MVGALCDPRLQTVTEYSPPGAFRPSRLRLHPGPTHLRLMRMTAGAVGLAGLVFGILAIGPFVEQHQHEMRPLAVLSFAVLVGLPVAIGLWGSWAPLPVLMTLAALESVVLPLVLVAWPLTHGDASIQSDGIPWPLGISALPIVCLALIARGAFVWGYLGLIGALTVYVMFVSNGRRRRCCWPSRPGCTRHPSRRSSSDSCSSGCRAPSGWTSCRRGNGLALPATPPSGP